MSSVSRYENLYNQSNVFSSSYGKKTTSIIPINSYYKAPTTSDQKALNDRVTKGAISNLDSQKTDGTNIEKLRKRNQQLQKQILGSTKKESLTVEKTEKLHGSYHILSNQSEKILLKNQQVDLLNLAEDFISANLPPEKMGFKHTWKRLDLFCFIIRYIEENKEFLNADGFIFSDIFQKNQFTATTYRVPSSFIAQQTQYKNVERCHCSVINKLAVLNAEGELKILDQAITIDNLSTTLIDLLNICDIAPSEMNAVDWYIEFRSRQLIMQVLKDVQAGQLSALSAISNYVDEYSLLLQELKTALENNKYEHAKNFDQYLYYKQNVETILSKDLLQTYRFIRGYQVATERYKVKLKTCSTLDSFPLFKIPN